MAYTGEQVALTYKAASLVGAHLPVFQNTASSRDGVAVPAASTNQDVIGLTRATGASVGNSLAVIVFGNAKARAGASLGAGALVGLASTNGALGPLAAAPTHIASGGSLQPRFIVGRSKEAAAAGDLFTVFVNPREIV